MKILRTLLVIVAVFLIVWIDVPDSGIPIQISLGKININKTVRPPQITTRFFGKDIKKEIKMQLGLDLRGGAHLVFEADMKEIAPDDRTSALEGARNIVEQRVNFFGVSEPSVQTLQSGGSYRIVVDLPGTQNIKEAVSLIGQTARLEFTEEASSEAKQSSDPAQLLTITKKTGLSGTHVKRADVQFDQTGKPAVGLEFNNEGAKIFEQVTKRNIGKPVGIFLDNIPLSIPVVQQVISGGQAIITGDFTTEEARRLAIAINSGALPVSINLVEERTIGPTLGAEQVQKSVFAGVVGLCMVIVFMVLYYGRLGIIASFSLVIYGLITLAIFKLVPVVLTLPGIAGFILSIGMAVDANILIFERIKEEMREGKEFSVARRLGFGRAIDAIKDANVTTILVAFILFNPLNWGFFPQFGLVKGFALTLIIGVTTSLFTGVIITRRLIDVFYTEK